MVRSGARPNSSKDLEVAVRAAAIRLVVLTLAASRVEVASRRSSRICLVAKVSKAEALVGSKVLAAVARPERIVAK